MAKYIINVTFCVEQPYVEAWKNWLKNSFLPSVDGSFHHAKTMRVMTHVEPGINNFSVQHEVDDFHALTLWKQNHEEQMKTDLFKQFGQHVLTFTTFLELL